MAENKPLEVVWSGDYHTAQIYSMGFEFAFLSPAGKGRFEQATTFVYCKDFLHDAVWSHLHGKAVSIYGFQYKPGKNRPLCMSHTAMAFRNTQYEKKPESFHARMGSTLDLLHKAEKQLHFRPSYVQRIEHPQGPCWVIIGDRRWQWSPPMLSLYTLMIRLGFAHNPEHTLEQTIERAVKGEIKIGPNTSYAGNRDASYIASSEKGVRAIFRHGLALFHDQIQDNYPKSVGTSDLHNNYGIVNFTAGTPKAKMPHWYREELWKE